MSDNLHLIKSSELLETITKAKNELGFTLLLDITAVDNLYKSYINLRFKYLIN